ncbi:MAG TPA: hypothetical protein VGH05_18060 [Buttiauxella sp.]|jgi:hypothetical protein
MRCYVLSENVFFKQAIECIFDHPFMETLPDRRVTHPLCIIDIQSYHSIMHIYRSVEEISLVDMSIIVCGGGGLLSSILGDMVDLKKNANISMLFKLLRNVELKNKVQFMDALLKLYGLEKLNPRERLIAINMIGTSRLKSITLNRNIQMKTLQASTISIAKKLNCSNTFFVHYCLRTYFCRNEAMQK